MYGGVGAICITDRMAPALTMAALRAAEDAFDATVYVIVPLPVPDAPLVTESQFALLVVV